MCKLLSALMNFNLSSLSWFPTLIDSKFKNTYYQSISIPIGCMLYSATYLTRKCSPDETFWGHRPPCIANSALSPSWDILLPAPSPPKDLVQLPWKCWRHFSRTARQSFGQLAGWYIFLYVFGFCFGSVYILFGKVVPFFRNISVGWFVGGGAWIRATGSYTFLMSCHY